VLIDLVEQRLEFILQLLGSMSELESFNQAYRPDDDVDVFHIDELKSRVF
jgi:hypothetical protein